MLKFKFMLDSVNKGEDNNIDVFVVKLRGVQALHVESIYYSIILKM